MRTNASPAPVLAAKSVEEILTEQGELVIPASTAQVSNEIGELVAAGRIVVQTTDSLGHVARVKITLSA